MSWFARSLVNSLVGDEDDDDDNLDANLKDQEIERSNRSPTDGGGDKQSVEPGIPTRGVKEDLSELTKTLTRQFWGVASFLAPPPSSPPATSSSQSDRGRRLYSSDPTSAEGSDDAEVVDSPRLAGIRNDFAEIGGKFRSGISMLSNAKAVSEISKIASNFLPFGFEEEDVEEKSGGGRGAVGVTDEVLAFARNISMHPETWLDFPLISDDEDSDDFDMSNAQQEHALAVERLEPRLAALRIELCPSHMSEGRFWKIYFVLLHSRLNKHDAELLTTPQIAQARAMLLQDLQGRTKPNSEGSGRGVSPSHKDDDTSSSSEENVISPSKTLSETTPLKTLTLEEPTISVPVTDIETEKHAVQTAEVKIVDKSVIEEELPVQAKSRDSHSDTSTNIPIQKYEEDGDDWLAEETGEAGGSGGTTTPFGHEEDVSFSDLEDDDDHDEPKNTRANTKAIESQPKDSGDWIQLSKGLDGAAKGGNSTSPQNKESNDWLNVDDIDSE